MELERVASCAGSSILFASRSTGLCAMRRISATSSSPGVMPARASTTKRTRSASSTAARAWSAIERVIGVGRRCRRRPCRSAGSAARSTRRRAPCGRASRRASRGRRRRASPSAGSRASTCRRSGSRRSRRCRAARGRCSSALIARMIADQRQLDRVRAGPRACTLAEPVPEPADLALDLGGRLAVALRRSSGARRSASARPRAIEHGCEVADPPVVRAVDRRRARPARSPAARPSRRRAAPGRARRFAASCPRRRGRARARRGRPRASSAPPRGRTRRGAPRRCRSARISWPSPGDAVRLDLRHEVDGARRGGAERRRVDPREVVERQHEPALAGHALRAVHAERRRTRDQPADRDAADLPRDVDADRVMPAASRGTSSSIRATTSSIAELGRVDLARRPRPAASAPRRSRRGAGGRSRARRRRARAARRSGAARAPPRRRAGRPSPPRRGDDGADVAALDHDVALLPSSRWRSRITSRTGWWRATDETTRSMRGSRISVVTSRPSMKTRRRPRT